MKSIKTFFNTMARAIYGYREEPARAIYEYREEPIQGRDVLGSIMAFFPREQSVDLAVEHPFFRQALRAHRPCIEKSHLLCALLDDIAHGREEKIVALLEDLSQTDPKKLAWLLAQKGSIKNPSGTFFDSVTCLQLAAFNLDSPLRNLISHYMDQNEASRQIHELDKNGLDYSISRTDYDRLVAIAPDSVPPIKTDLESKEEPDDFVTLNEKCYHWGFRVLETALRAYIHDFFTGMSTPNTHNWDLLEKPWLNVGFAQRSLTPPFIHAYCGALGFDPLPDFRAADLSRTSSFYNYDTYRDESWFDSLGSSDFGLGFSFGIIKGPSAAAWGGWAALRWRGERADADLAALAALWEARTQDLHAFKEDFCRSQLQPQRF